MDRAMSGPEDGSLSLLKYGDGSYRISAQSDGSDVSPSLLAAIPTRRRSYTRRVLALVAAVLLGSWVADVALAWSAQPSGSAASGQTEQPPAQFSESVTPLSDYFKRDDVDAIFDDGSMFGHLHVKLDCPAAPHLSATLEVRSDDTDDDSDMIYRPNQVFPVGQLVPEGLSSTSAASQGELTLLIGILSACNAVQARHTARHTWMRLEVPGGTTWRAVFLLSHKCKNSVKWEQSRHGDLLFLPVQESYYSLTPKVLEFFAYAHSVGANYTMKTDDDTFVFVDRILMELQTMPGKCLYWGAHASLPSHEDYRGSQIGSNPLNKWWIQESYFKAIAGAKYMVGGAYVLSKDLVRKVFVNRQNFSFPDPVPEDAAVGTVLGRRTFEQCGCSDSRHVKHITSFQHIQLFHEGILPCERADISRRALTLHGFKNMTQMREVFRYATQYFELGCDMGTREYTGRNVYSKFWGRETAVSAKMIDPVEAMNSWHGRLMVPPKSPWDVRENFTLYSSLWDGPSEVYAGEALVPLWYVLVNGMKNPGPSGPSPGRAPSGQQSSNLPWCLRLKWASEAMDMLADLTDHKTLLCDLRATLYYVHAPTLDLKLHKGILSTQYSEERFYSGTACYADNQCRSCFKEPSFSGLPNAVCDLEKGKCVGYDAVAQTKVGISNTVLALLSNESELRSHLTQEEGIKLSALLQDLRGFAGKGPGKGIDAGADGIHGLVDRMRDILDFRAVQSCVQQQRRQGWEKPPAQL